MIVFYDQETELYYFGFIFVAVVVVVVGLCMRSEAMGSCNGHRKLCCLALVLGWMEMQNMPGLAIKMALSLMLPRARALHGPWTECKKEKNKANLFGQEYDSLARQSDIFLLLIELSRAKYEIDHWKSTKLWFHSISKSHTSNSKSDFVTGIIQTLYFLFVFCPKSTASFNTKANHWLLMNIDNRSSLEDDGVGSAQRDFVTQNGVHEQK